MAGMTTFMAFPFDEDKKQKGRGFEVRGLG
jgi:hypothetical protein